MISTVLFVKLNLGLYTDTDTNTHSHRRTTLSQEQILTQLKHTGEPSFFGLTWLRGVKGKKEKKKKDDNEKTNKKKKRLQVAIECLDLSRSLQPEQVRPPLLVQLAYNAFQCMQDCARGILFNDRLIYILMINAR